MQLWIEAKRAEKRKENLNNPHYIEFERKFQELKEKMKEILVKTDIIVTECIKAYDFLNTESSILIDGQLTKVHKSASWKGVLNEDSEWFTIDYGKAIAYVKDIHKDYKKYLEKSRKTYHHIKTNFSFDAMKDKLASILDSRLPDFPKQVAITLPKLNKVSEAPKLILPKLKKIE